MRKTFILFLLCTVCTVASAQSITHTFENVSLSDALVYLQEHTKDSHITFIYNDLEDFRVTATVRNSTVKDAIVQLIGFYPIRLVEDEEGELYVECTQNAPLRYKGRVIDEKGQPVEYANISLLSRRDSSYITGGISNASGYFVIPCEAKEVIAKVSYVGYKTVWRKATQTSLGTIRLQHEVYTILHEVNVTANSTLMYKNKISFIPTKTEKRYPTEGTTFSTTCRYLCCRWIHCQRETPFIIAAPHPPI